MFAAARGVRRAGLGGARAGRDGRARGAAGCPEGAHPRRRGRRSCRARTPACRRLPQRRAADEPIQIDSRRRPSPVSWFLVAAAGIAIVALIASNLLALGRLGASEQFERDVAAVLEAGSQPGALTAVLAPTEPGGPRGLAAVSSTGSSRWPCRISIRRAGNEVYEGWVIVGDAAPAPLGGFTVGDPGTGPPRQLRAAGRAGHDARAHAGARFRRHDSDAADPRGRHGRGSGGCQRPGRRAGAGASKRASVAP